MIRNLHNYKILAISAVLLLSAVVHLIIPNITSARQERDDIDVFKSLATRCSERGSLDSWSFDDVLCINGEIGTKMLVDIENVEWTAVDTVIVDSGGGDVAIAIQIAEKIASQKITLVVRGRCLSSCANYLFIAASLKIVLKDSKIGWHGGPGTAEDYGISDPARAEKINSIRKLSDDFLTKMGVSTEILYSAPQWAVSEGERRKSLGADLRSFTWSYNAEELLRRFNVKNVLFER